MTTLLDPALDLSLAPLTNTPLASTDVTFEIADQATDIANFPDPGVLGYYAWVWAREPSFPNVGDAARAGFAERVRVTARDLGLMTLTVTRDGVTPIDLNVSGVTYWLVAPMNAKYVDDIDERLFDFVGGNLVTAKTVEIDLLLADQIDMGVATPGVGLLRFLEDTANGTSAVTLQSPAALAGDVAITLLDALPGGTEFLQISAGGLMSTTPTVGVSLDGAYDFGGAGAGRIINANAGPVEINGQGLLLAPTSRIVWETSVAEFNYRTICQLDRFDIQFGSQDADASNDVFNTFLSMSRNSGENRVGLNTNTPSDLLHLITDGSGAARIRLQTNVAAVDVSIMFLEQTNARWEIGYDDSAGGFVVGRLTFANPIIFVEDTTGRVGIHTIVPAANYSVDIRNTGTDALLNLVSASTTATTAIDFTWAGSFANGFRLERTSANGGPFLVFVDTGGSSQDQIAGSGWGVTNQGLVEIGQVSDGTRPAAAAVPAGTIAWSTTDAVLIVSDATDWRLVHDNSIT